MNAPIETSEAALSAALAETRAWVDRVVIGLNLCPFARAARQRDRTRLVGCAATEPEALLAAFCDAARSLLEAPVEAVETTLLVHPFVLTDFDDYNDFLDVADAALDALGATGVLQVASFHPDYRFAGTAADDVSNATNRSPHPLLQLLRERSIEAAAAAWPDPAVIYEANVATLQRLGPSGWQALQDACRADARASCEPALPAPAPPDR
jgi:hypothetical protein